MWRISALPPRRTLGTHHPHIPGRRTRTSAPQSASDTERGCRSRCSSGKSRAACCSNTLPSTYIRDSAPGQASCYLSARIRIQILDPGELQSAVQWLHNEGQRVSKPDQEPKRSRLIRHKAITVKRADCSSGDCFERGCEAHLRPDLAALERFVIEERGRDTSRADHVDLDGEAVELVA